MCLAYLHPLPPAQREKMLPLLLFSCAHSSYSASKFPLNCLGFCTLSFQNREIRRVTKEYNKVTMMYGLQKLCALRPLLSQMRAFHQRLCPVLQYIGKFLYLFFIIFWKEFHETTLKWGGNGKNRSRI